ncbi:MAG: hypothetical protein D6729_03095 [Deltaproteobacteria bacterium]|nr:MAG: hypothetical protein D6729_03095 [Deltaproteobacteria bacterium]
MGLLSRLFGGGKSLEDEYFEALVALGEAVVASPPRGVRLRHLPAALKAAEAMQNRRIELEMLEQAMEEEEAEHLALCAEEDAEIPELEERIASNPAGIANIERKIGALKKQLIAKQANMKYFVRQFEAQQEKVDKLTQIGEFEKANAEKEILKKVRIDLMRQESSLKDIEDQIEVYLAGEGEAGDAMRAKLRYEEIQRERAERERELEETLELLDQQADAKEAEIEEMKEAYEEAMAAVGEEVYAARLPQFAEHYRVLDPIAAELAG